VRLTRLGERCAQGDEAEKLPWYDPNRENLMAAVSTRSVQTYGTGDKLILVVDCGLKLNQLRSVLLRSVHLHSANCSFICRPSSLEIPFSRRCFLRRGVRVKVVPWDYDIASDSTWDGLFVSNGPGDPSYCQTTVTQLRRALALVPPKPIFGICMGHQLLGLAAGARTYKLPYGNRGHNQPCIDQRTKRCFLTLQNHGTMTRAGRAIFDGSLRRE
jgi:carbamoylphosphate synthase small subunit